MIEPYEAGQVRYHGDERVISYGVSSYGYDVRCADEFKIFTNIHSKTVDPKNFDDDAFVDIKGDYCIIPPNSFASGANRRIFQNSTSGIDGMFGEINLCSLWHYR